VAETTASNPGVQLYERFRPGQKPPTKLGSSRDYNVDMVPKFIMAGGELVRVLVHTGVPLPHTHFAAAESCAVDRHRVYCIWAAGCHALCNTAQNMRAVAKHPAVYHTDIFSVADVTKYLEFKAVDGSFVLSKNVVQKVPATDMEAIRSPLMGLLEKNRARKFFS